MDAKYKKNSLVGRVYFWYYRVTGEERPPEEDTYHVGKVVFLFTPLTWFFEPIFGTVRPYMIAIVAAGVYLCIRLYIQKMLFLIIGMVAVLLLIISSLNLLIFKVLPRFCRRFMPNRPVRWD